MFVAVYWWRVHPGSEAQFREAWRRGAEQIVRVYGSFGSRLHRDRAGRFVGYAEWPDEAAWQRAFEAKTADDDPEARRLSTTPSSRFHHIRRACLCHHGDG